MKEERYSLAPQGGEYIEETKWNSISPKWGEYINQMKFVSGQPKPPNTWYRIQ